MIQLTSSNMSASTFQALYFKKSQSYFNIYLHNIYVYKELYFGPNAMQIGV